MQGFDRTNIRVDTSDGRNITHVSGFSYTNKDGEVIEVPPLSTGDGASSPPATWPIIPPFGWYWICALLHDHAYRNLKKPKAWCDAMLLESMLWLIEQMPSDTIEHRLKKEARRVEATLIYDGVVFGGKASFDGDRKNQGGNT